MMYGGGGGILVVLIIIIIIWRKYRKKHPKLGKGGWGKGSENAFKVSKTKSYPVPTKGSFKALDPADVQKSIEKTKTESAEPQFKPRDYKKYEKVEPPKGLLKLISTYKTEDMMKKAAANTEITFSDNKKALLAYTANVSKEKDSKPVKIAMQFSSSPTDKVAFLDTHRKYFATQVLAPVAFLLEKYPTISSKQIFIILHDNNYPNFATEVDNNDDENLIVYLKQDRFEKNANAGANFYTSIFHEVFHHLDQVKASFFAMNNHNVEAKKQLKKASKVKDLKDVDVLDIVANLVNDVMVEKSLTEIAPREISKERLAHHLHNQIGHANDLQTKYVHNNKLAKANPAMQFYLLTTNPGTHIPTWFAVMFKDKFLKAEVATISREAVICWESWEKAISVCNKKVQAALLNLYLPTLTTCIRSIFPAIVDVAPGVHNIQYQFTAPPTAYENFIDKYVMSFNSFVK